MEGSKREDSSPRTLLPCSLQDGLLADALIRNARQVASKIQEENTDCAVGKDFIETKKH